MGRTGTLEDTYLAALQHDIVDPGDATLVGVVRRPPRWFAGSVDENRSALGPPAALLDEFDRRHEELKIHGMCDEGAHNAAWEELSFAERYREHLASEEAQAAVDDLLSRLLDGEDVALVCFENTDEKRCHRTILREELDARL